MKSENEEDHERNIEDIIQDDDYNSPWENKAAMVATGLRIIAYSSDSDKNPAARKEPLSLILEIGRASCISDKITYH